MNDGAKLNAVLICLVFAVGVAMGYYVGKGRRPPEPGRHTYTSMQGVPVRINTRTGEAHLLVPDKGWMLITAGDLRRE